MEKGEVGRGDGGVRGRGRPARIGRISPPISEKGVVKRGRPRKVDPREARIAELEAEVARLRGETHHPAIVAACRAGHGERCQCTYCRSAG